MGHDPVRPQAPAQRGPARRAASARPNRNPGWNGPAPAGAFPASSGRPRPPGGRPVEAGGVIRYHDSICQGCLPTRKTAI